MRYLAFILLCALAFAGYPVHQATAVVAGPTTLIGTPCPNQLGITKKDTLDMNIVACLCDTVPNCDPTTNAVVWKEMATDIVAVGTFACPAGQALTGIKSGVPQCAAL